MYNNNDITATANANAAAATGSRPKPTTLGAVHNAAKEGATAALGAVNTALISLQVSALEKRMDDESKKDASSKNDEKKSRDISKHFSSLKGPKIEPTDRVNALICHHMTLLPTDDDTDETILDKEEKTKGYRNTLNNCSLAVCTGLAEVVKLNRGGKLCVWSDIEAEER
ncbi:hypothetical protein MBANPS3_010814 [Mucor bainieri]